MGQGIRPLTVVSLDKLAAGIARATTELTNEEYTAQITRIDFESDRFACLYDTTLLTVRLSLPHMICTDECENGIVAGDASPTVTSDAP